MAFLAQPLFKDISEMEQVSIIRTGISGIASMLVETAKKKIKKPKY
jgi:hypothetical protein